MSSYEVVFTLFSIVYGLLLADVFRSLHFGACLEDLFGAWLEDLGKLR